MEIQCNDVTKKLIEVFSNLLHMDPSEIDPKDILLEIGADSLVLVEVIKAIESHYNVKLSIRQLFEELPSIEAIAEFIDTKKQASSEEPLNKSEFEKKSTTSSEDINNSLCSLVSGLLHIPENEIEINSPLLEVGADSLILVELIKRIDQKYGVKLTIRQLFEEFLTIEEISRHINSNIKTKPDESSSFNNKIINIMKREEELPPPSGESVKNEENWSLGEETKVSLSEIQTAYLTQFITRYNQKTSQSKALAEKYNDVLCNSRRSFAVVRKKMRNLFYTIHSKESSGSKFIDVNGNEYLDIAMGFGVHLFGHNPDFLVEALAKQLKLGLHLGPEHPQVGVVASYINELTGCERIVFCNTGTEAIMTAIRIARAYTKRKKIAVFKNSYHGHCDSTLVVPDIKQPGYKALPMAIGTPQSLVDDTIVLDYNSKSSIEFIQQYGHQLAAVLIEPVQNRRPDLHPIEFLKSLRKETSKHDIPLIFDEILVGFRIAQGGAQEWAGVNADMVTYGKIIGGGIPVAIIGGKKEIMSFVDGGVEGDRRTETTYTAGTFIKNPLAITAMEAVLSEIKKRGKELQLNLNIKSQILTDKLNVLFNTYNVPFQLNSFGSFFRFSQAGNLSFIYRPIELDLFFYHMIYNGVYLWEGGTCFLSTAHSNEDINFIVETSEKSIKEMIEGGFFAENNKFQIKRAG